MNAPVNTDLAMIVIPESSNAKTGNIIQSYSHRDTCPNRCPFKDNGCYADSYHTSRQWDRCEDTLDNRYVSNGLELTFSLLTSVAIHAKKGEKEVLFRHNVAGDIAHINSNMIDGWRVGNLVHSCSKVEAMTGIKVKGYTYTHCTPSLQNIKIAERATKMGFTINFSCETLDEVREVKLLDCNAVITSVDPEETVKAIKAEGFKALQCPAQTIEGMDCKKCKLCSRDREAVIVFKVHGTGSKKARKVIMLKTGKVA